MCVFHQHFSPVFKIELLGDRLKQIQPLRQCLIFWYFLLCVQDDCVIVGSELFDDLMSSESESVPNALYRLSVLHVICVYSKENCARYMYIFESQFYRSTIE